MVFLAPSHCVQNAQLLVEKFNRINALPLSPCHHHSALFVFICTEFILLYVTFAPHFNVVFLSLFCLETFALWGRTCRVQNYHPPSTNCLKFIFDSQINKLPIRLAINFPTLIVYCAHTFLSTQLNNTMQQKLHTYTAGSLLQNRWYNFRLSCGIDLHIKEGDFFFFFKLL